MGETRGRNVLHVAHRIFALYMLVACILLVLIFMIVGIASLFRPPDPAPSVKAKESQLPQERVDKYYARQEENVQAFEDHNLGTEMFGSGPEAHGDLPLTMDVSQAKEPSSGRRLGEQALWDGMQFIVENKNCMDTRILLCELLLDGLCDCANSSVQLLVGEKPSKIKIHCDPGDTMRLVHSSTYDYAGITRQSAEEQKAHSNRGESTLESGITKVVEKGDNLEVTGLDVNVSAKIQAIPTIDLLLGDNSVAAKVSGSVTTTINFTVETHRPLLVQGSDIIHMPNPPVVKQRCVAFVCFGMMFQAAVRLSFVAEGHARVQGSVSAEFSFLSEGLVDGAGEPYFEANISDINYWSDIPYAPFLGRNMQFNVSVIPMITIFTVPGIPMSFMNRIKWQVKESRAEGSFVRRAGMNIHTKQYFDSYGLPPSLLVTWPQIEEGLNMTVRASSVRVPEALQAMAAACNVTFPATSLSAIKTNSQRSTETVRLMIPDSLQQAFPRKVRKYGPRFCWTVGKTCTAAMTEPNCTADESLYCPATANAARPNAIPMKTMHIHPSGAIAFNINLDCNYDALKKRNDGKLYKDMQNQLKQTIAYEAVAGSGAGLSAEDVHLTPVPGRLGVLEATITPKDEVASEDILKQFAHPRKIKQALTKNLGLIKGISDVCPLPESVVGKISTPMVKVCPQSFCPSGALKMRSHGKHSFCRAKGEAAQNGQLKQKKYFNLESCQAACLKDDNCYGIEYEYMLGVKNCELWMQPIHFCSVVPASSDVDGQKSLFECYSKCDRTNTPVVETTSFPDAKELKLTQG